MKTLFSLLLVLLAVGVSAQHGHCAYDQVMQWREQQFPGYRSIQNEWFREAVNHGGSRSEVLEIPVVFHIVWNTESQNIPDEVIQSQIDVLNEDFRRLNENAINTREIFLPIAADPEIEFYLATTDPEGNPTNGIVRTNTDREDFELNLFSLENTLDEVKFSESGGSDAWDTERYMNVWVCNITSALGQIFGLAYPPEDLENWPDGAAEPTAEVSGIIVHYTTVGRNNPAADEDEVIFNNEGRTLVHETGHYLGLRHIWGDGFFNGCSVDDGIDDTPNVSAAGNYTCNFDANTCDDGDGDFPDNVENYMDYNQDDCMNMFTQGQVDLMRWVIENRRPGLLGEEVVGINSKYEESIKIYPNPLENGLLQLQSINSPAQLSICNALGELTFSQNLLPGQNSIDLQTLPAGMYFLRVNELGANNFGTAKLVIR